MMKTRIYYILMMAMMLGTVQSLAQTPAPTRSRVMIYGNVYGGGELAQVAAPADQVESQLIKDSDLDTLFTKEHTYTTYIHLGKNAEVYGKTFGGGKGHVDSAGESHGRVIGQTDIALDGATVWSELYGGGEMADVRGNSLIHFKKGKAGHNAFGGGLGLLGGADNLPDNQRTVLASADIKKIEFINDNPFTAEFETYPNLATLTAMTGNTYVVFDGDDTDETYTHYEFKEARTVNRDANGKPELRDGLYYTKTPQYNPENESQLFSINHNLYGGGMTASSVDGNTYMHIKYGMVNQEMMDYTGEERTEEKVWTRMYNSIANAQFCVFGGGYGYYAEVQGNTNVTMDVEGSHAFRYLSAFKADFDEKVGSNPADNPEFIAQQADQAKWSHGAPGRSCMDVVGGGYNGRVNGTTNVTISGDVVVRKVYGGGYYAAVDSTNVNIKSGLFNRVYGGGMMGNVNGKATLTVGQTGFSTTISTHNRHLIVKSGIYGGNDVSGTVGTVKSLLPVSHNGVEYYTFNPVDDDDHGVRLTVRGGLVLGDIYGAGNGNHPGYSNPDYMQFDHSQHPSENYRTLPQYAKNEDEGGGFYKTRVYKYRPRTGRVEMRLQGNEGNNFNDGASTDKLRIWGRTFGGGNSCNVGIWDGSQDDKPEVFDPDPELSWHPGENFMGGGTISISVGSHVQFGNRNDSHVTPNGIFMGCNGEHMVTQHTDVEASKTYHQYYDKTSQKYWPGFPVYYETGETGTPFPRLVGLPAFKGFLNNILTRSDNVSINFDDNVQDVWMSNFVGGGYRGSMQADTETGNFKYSLPEGVTVGHAIVGGSFNAHVIYRIYATTDGHEYELNDGNYQYEWREDMAGEVGTDYLRTIVENDSTHFVRYNFDGGMLAHDSEMNATSTGSRIHKVHNPELVKSADFTSRDEGGNLNGYNGGKENALVILELRNKLHPMVHEATETTPLNVHGGIVYGGCYYTGFVEGDTWVDYRCSLSPLCTDKRFFDKTQDDIYEHVKDMTKNNALNVFGAGYGEDTHTMGDAYLRVLHNGKTGYPLIYNAFGGGNMGTVAGNTSVFYNVGEHGTMMGSLYGGGYKGTINGNTFVELTGGVALNVYGGSREADIGGTAHIWAYDGAIRPFGEDEGDTPDNMPLILGNVYGGNDISGTIAINEDAGLEAVWTQDTWPLVAGKKFSSYVQVAGTQDAGRGYPLIGNIYAGGNGEFTPVGERVPDVKSTLIELNGGTTVRAFGGGNRATVTEQAFIFVNAPNEVFAEYTFPNYQKSIINTYVFKDINTGFKWEGTKIVMDKFHVVNLFGGNNLAPMAIQPTWNLKKGAVENVYSGGNMGDMTYYNPAAGTTGHENERKGLSIDVYSPEIYIYNLYGGCRMSDVCATDGEGNPVTLEGEDTSDRYGANVIVTGGHINNVYGGNDISGKVHNGSRLDITGGMIGNVFGAGNGNYVYAYDSSDTPVSAVTEMVGVDKDKNNYLYYVVPRDGDVISNPLYKITYINHNVRPNVDRAYINIAGTDADHMVVVKGDVYSGGNSTTVSGTDNEGENVDVRMDIRNNVMLNGVYMGCNGEGLTQTTFLDRFFERNNITTVNTALLDEVMKAVDMNALPKGFEDPDVELVNTNVGVFCLGGNAGSMTTTKHLTFNFPAGLTIFNRIVGGCNNTDFTYKGFTHKGGFTGNLTDGDTKVTLNILNQFEPKYLKIETDASGKETTASLQYLMDNKDGKDVFSERRCNVYGGCFTSGTMNGGVEVNIKTDMLARVEGQTLDDKDGTTLLKNTNYMKYTSTKSQANIPYVFTVFGGGYGAGTLVNGDIHVTMPKYESLPQVNTIYGGSEQGKVIGNVTIEVRNGTVYNSIFGGSDAARLYGSTQTIVGYPSYYRCNTSKEYILDRSDKSEDNRSRYSFEHNNRKVIRDHVKYMAGDLVATNVFDIITNKDGGDFELVPAGAQWDGTRIKIGDGIYGGGFSSSYSAEQSAGTYTVCYYDADNTPSLDAIGYGGNSTIIVADDPDSEHITISERPEGATATSKNVLGSGGIFGCGHLVFTQGFKTADVTNYGYAAHTVTDPLPLNTFQRLDLLTLRDCCLQLWGSRDFAADKVDATSFSVARVMEINLQSSIDASGTLSDYATRKARNYVCFMNNVHNIGSIVTNDAFETGSYHNETGAVSGLSYQAFKYNHIIDGHRTSEDADFKQRNLGTARNLIGINNGYCLNVLNEYKDGSAKKNYYGPVIGVAEVKLLTYQTGEGGGYVYADNLHTYTGTDDDKFLQRQGNLVFPGTQDNNYIVDDCFPTHYFAGQDAHNEAAAHYWYVTGTKYFFNTVLTGYTYDSHDIANKFTLNNDANTIMISGLVKGNPLALESVWWKSNNNVDGYTSDLHSAKDGYKFTITVGDDANKFVYQPMPRDNSNITDDGTEWGTPTVPVNLETAEKYNSTTLPVFNLELEDRIDNSGTEYYEKHMAKPEEVLIVMKAEDTQGLECTYYINAVVQYLQGPEVSGDLIVENCALPGEVIHVTDQGVAVAGDAEMIITDIQWKLLPLNQDGTYCDPGSEQAIPIDKYLDDAKRNLYIPALYSQNGYKVAFTFQAMGKHFSYTGSVSGSHKSNLEVHNYHRMKDVEPQNLDPQAGARIYIEDEEDLAAFVSYLNKATLGNDAGIPVGLAGIDVILQNNITMTATQTVTVPFAGTLHGDGYYIGLPNEQQSLFGSNLSGKTYNLGVVGGSIATAGDRINCFDINTDADALRYGSAAYALSHYFKPGEGIYNPDGYVEQYYANGDYQYAGIRNTDVDANTPYLRTGAPNYGSIETRHDVEHHVDPRRWNETDEINVPLYTAEYDNDYLYFGQHLDLNDGDSHPVHISSVAENRVYQTAGYYQSGVDEKFHYNLDAWALQPSLTAIDYNNQTVEGDGASTQPTSFSVDSNADYDYHGSYDNSTVGHVTQNLLVYNAGESIFTMSESADIDESNVVYHNIANGATANFHLVDKQDFWCPIEFDVTNRTWYERLPQSWREIASAADYHAGSAWEGIALPFTVKDVRGMEEGNLLSHFYGEVPNDATAATNDRTLHHEYWLAGMVAASGDKASFERPAVSGTGLFTQAGQASGDYEYRNNYYVTLDKYNSHFGTRQEDNWYSLPHTFADYVYLSNNVPYLVSFPGESFYEFDLTGQVITFDGKAGLTVPVTVEGETTIGDVSHKASFLHRDSERGVNSDGDAFEQDTPVLPFRTYLAAASHSVPHRVNIVDGMGDIPHGDPQGDEQQEEYVNVYVSGKNIVVESSIKTQLPVYATNGVLLLTIDVEPGITRQPMDTGIYIMPGKKLVVR